MKKEAILTLLQSLAKSQGCWGRLLRDWEENGLTEIALHALEQMNFKDSLELVMFLEGNA